MADFEESVALAEAAGYRVWFLNQRADGIWCCTLYLISPPNPPGADPDLSSGITEMANARTADEAISLAMQRGLRSLDTRALNAPRAPAGSLNGVTSAAIERHATAVARLQAALDRLA